MKPYPGERELLRSSGRLGLRRGGSEMSILGLGFREVLGLGFWFGIRVSVSTFGFRFWGFRRFRLFRFTEPRDLKSSDLTVES